MFKVCYIINIENEERTKTMKTTDKNGNRIETQAPGAYGDVTYFLDYTTKRIDTVPAKSWIWRGANDYEIIIYGATKKEAIARMEEFKRLQNT